MAPPRKPAERRQRRHRTDIGLVPAAGGPVEVPPASKDWLVATKKRWESYWGSNIAAVADPGSDLPALLRLFGYYDELERAGRAFRRKRFVEGSRSQPRLNPLAKHIAELEGAIRQLEDRFGLTPKARLQLGVEFATAHRSLEALNASFDPGAPDGEEDPRLTVIEAQAD